MDVIGKALLVLCSLGCGGKFQYGREIDPHTQVVATQQKVANNQYEFGHLIHGVIDGGELEAIPKARSWGASGKSKVVTFGRIEGTQICFEMNARVGNDVEVQRELYQLSTKYKLVVGTHASLDDWKKGTPWPSPTAANTLGKVTPRKNDGRQRYDHKDPNVEGSPTVEFCGPSPTITETTKFLTVAVLVDGHPEENYLLIWDFAGKRR
jgi:hypothetical protein